MPLEQRNTPTTIIGYSQVQRISSWRARTTLPIVETALNPQRLDSGMVEMRIQGRRKVQKKYYDRGARKLPSLKEGDNMWVQWVPNNPNVWVSGSVKRFCGNIL